MRALIIALFCFLFFAAHSQTAEQVFRNYRDAMGKWSSVSYRMNKIDTFTNGTVWNKTGFALIKKSREARDLGFIFKAKRDDVDAELVFDGENIYTVNHMEKSYQLDRAPVEKRIVGKPAGQMILNEAIDTIKNFQSIALARTDTTFILRFDFADTPDFTDRVIHLHIDIKTYFPVLRYFTQVADGRYTQVIRLTDVRVDAPDIERQIREKEFLNSYTYVPQKETISRLSSLVGKEAPDFSLTSVDGKHHQLSKKRGKVVLLDFWDIWCGPCVQSIAMLQALAAKYPGDRFELVSIVTDKRTYSKIADFVKAKKISYPALFGDTASADGYYVYGVPQYVLIDEHGIVRYAKSGTTAEIGSIVAGFVNKK
ncbi:MAG TPA: TlpA disulfide reductase family protein [Chryseosolibacter sp.]